MTTDLECTEVRIGPNAGFDHHPLRGVFRRRVGHLGE